MKVKRLLLSVSNKGAAENQRCVTTYAALAALLDLFPSKKKNNKQTTTWNLVKYIYIMCNLSYFSIREILKIL